MLFHYRDDSKFTDLERWLQQQEQEQQQQNALCNIQTQEERKSNNNNATIKQHNNNNNRGEGDCSIVAYMARTRLWQANNYDDGDNDDDDGNNADTTGNRTTTGNGARMRLRKQSRFQQGNTT